MEHGRLLRFGQTRQDGVLGWGFISQFAGEVVVGKEIGEVVEGHDWHRVVLLFEEGPSLVGKG